MYVCKIQKLELTQSVRREHQEKNLEDFLGFLQGPDPPEHGQQEHRDAGQQTGEYEACQHDYLSHRGFPKALLKEVHETVASEAVE